MSQGLLGLLVAEQATAVEKTLSGKLKTWFSTQLDLSLWSALRYLGFF